MARTIWPKASAVRVDRALSAHSVMGLVISALLFIICLSGTVAVFEDEIEWWEQPDSEAVETISPEAARTAAEAIHGSQPDTSHLYLYLPRDNWPRLVAGGDDGLSTANERGTLTGPYAAPWNEFLIHLHYYLNLPTSFGMILVAIFGVMLVAMTVSGFLAHPRIFRDAFRFRRHGQARLAQADLHNRLSVWGTPFHLTVALTGAMIGLFSVVALVLAQTSYDGDTRQLSQAVFGQEPAPDDAPAEMADVAAALTAMPTVAPEARPFLVVLHDPGTAGQHITIYGEHGDRLIYGETYNFDAAGSFIGHTGMSDGEAGQQIASSVYRLHFGDFGGIWIKTAYVFFGLGLCIVIASGLNIYFIKRAEAGRRLPRLESAWSALVWGCPAWLGLTLLASLFGVSGSLLAAVFWFGLLAFCLAALAWMKAADIARLARAVCGLSLLAATGIHAVRYFSNYDNSYVALVSLSLAGLGLWLVVEPAAKIAPRFLAWTVEMRASRAS